MDRQDIVVIGLTNFQKMQEEDENAAEMYGVQPPPGVYRVVRGNPGQGVRQGATWPGASDFIRRSEERYRMEKIFAHCPKCGQATNHKVLDKQNAKVKCLACGHEHSLD